MKAHFGTLSVCALVALLGCGGGGGGVSGAAITALDFLVAGVKGPYAYRATGSLDRYATRSDVPGGPSGLVKFARVLTSGGLGAQVGVFDGDFVVLGAEGRAPSGRKSGDWFYDSDLDLWYRVAEISDTRARVDFRADSSEGEAAGRIDLTLVDGLPYPVTVRMDYDVRSPARRLWGTMSVTAFDEDWVDGRIVAGTSLSRPATRVQFDLTVQSGVVRGDLRVQSAGRWLSFTEIVATDSTWKSQLSLDGRAGTVRWDADGSGEVTTEDQDGIWRLSWGPDSFCRLTAPTELTTDVGYIWDL